jgi:glutathione S-transferase
MTITLHCFAESGNAYKAALMLTLTGTAWQAQFVDFFNGATRTPEFRALNVMGEVPVLVDGDQTLTQSGAILMHLAARTGRFGGTTPAEQAEVLRWILFDAHKLSSQAGTLRFLMNFLPADKRDPAVIAFLQGRLMAGFKVLEAQLAQTDWLAAPGPTIADFANCSYLYYPEPFGFDRAAWPAIDRWLTRIAALPGWRHPYDLLPRGRTAP